MRLSASLTGDESVRRTLLQIGKQAAGRALAATAEDVELIVEREAATHTRTGALVRSIYRRRDGDAWEIGHDPQVAHYAIFVHWGTKPHKIRPRRKRALRWPAGAGFVFARGVNHPGYKGDAWLVRAADEAPRLFARYVQRQVERLQKGNP